MVYGAPLHLPGEFFILSSSNCPDVTELFPDCTSTLGNFIPYQHSSMQLHLTSFPRTWLWPPTYSCSSDLYMVPSRLCLQTHTKDCIGMKVYHHWGPRHSGICAHWLLKAHTHPSQGHRTHCTTSHTDGTTTHSGEWVHFPVHLVCNCHIQQAVLYFNISV